MYVTYVLKGIKRFPNIVQFDQIVILLKNSLSTIGCVKVLIIKKVSI